MTVDDAVEDVEDGVDAVGQGGGTTAGVQFGKTDQNAEHHRHLIERLIIVPSGSSLFFQLSRADALSVTLRLIERLHTCTRTTCDILERLASAPSKIEKLRFSGIGL